MAVDFKTGTNQLKLFNALTLNQKISLVVLAVAVIAGILSMVYLMNEDEYQTLYSDLSAEEASIVIERLQADTVPYRLADAGKSIQVPVDRVDELRLQLASQGLPQGGKIGFEIFDQSNLGMTEFLERVSYKRALEGELARTILSLKEIGEVRVHLVLPKESLFEAQSEPTKASVVLKLKSAKQLNETVVFGIVHLVSSAVEGLTPTNVTVVDSNGRLLSDTPGSAEEALTGNQADLKMRTERDLTSRVISLLEPVVGQGKVRADTSVLMDFSRSEQTEEKYDPLVAIRSQQKSEDRSDPVVADAAGVPGTPSNNPNPPVFIPIPTGRNANSFLQQSETTNYEVSKITRHTLEPVGEISKLSVAIIVDDAIRTETAPDGTTVRTPGPRSPEDLQKIRDLVTAAIGIDMERGDLLTIENIAFDVLPGFEEVTETFFQRWGGLARPAMRYGALLILFLLVVLLLVRPLTKRILAPVEVAELTAANRLDGTLAAGTPKTVKELEAALDQTSNSPLALGSDVQRVDILKQRIADFVQRDPEKGAKLLRAWLIEEGK